MNLPNDVRGIQRLLTDKAFNPYIDIRNREAVLGHLVEEVGELARAFMQKYSPSPKDFYPILLSRFCHGLSKNNGNIDDELGDVHILLSFCSESLGCDLQTAIKNKIMKNVHDGKFGVRNH